MVRTAQTCHVADLKDVGGDVEGALERVGVPAYMVDRHVIIRWLNPMASLIDFYRDILYGNVVGPAGGRYLRRSEVART